MKRILLVTLSCLLSVISFLSVAAEPRQEPTDRERARTVYIFHQPIVMLQAKFGLTTPEERVLAFVIRCAISLNRMFGSH